MSDVRCLRRGVLGSDLSVVRPYDHRQLVADVHALATTTHLCVVAASVDEPAKGRYASEQITLCDCGCSPGAPACTWLKKPIAISLACIPGRLRLASLEKFDSVPGFPSPPGC